MNINTSRWSAGAMAFACFAAQAQEAADAVDDATAPPLSQPASSTASAAQSLSETPLEQVIVTALRSNQALQDTPAAVTVISSEDLERRQILDVRGIQSSVPSARFSAANTSTRIFIRGVGSALDFYWIPETTAVNFNGVYVPRFATTGSFFDVENVQVLPGPQGVLYGRSAGGGAVAITANRPVHQMEASGTVEYGNYDSYRVEAMANVPLAESLALRGAVSVAERDGYQSFDLQGNDSLAARLSGLYEPTDDLSVLLWSSYFEQTGLPTASQYIPYIAGHDPWYVPATDPVTGRDNSSGSRVDFKYGLHGLDANYQWGAVNIRYLASYLRQTEEALRKLVGNDQRLDNAQDQYTQSLQFSGKRAALDWIGGIDWFYATSRYDVRFGPRQFGSIFPDMEQRSLSGFAQATYSLTPELRVVAGGRYTRDALSLTGTNSACFAVCVYPPVSFDETWNHFDAKAGVEVDITPQVLAYANIQTGYAPGTLNTFADTLGISKEVKPQTLLAYTAGMKSTLADGALTLNVEAYHYRYEDLIIQAFNASLGQIALFNAPEARVQGLQLMAELRLTRASTLSANVGYSDGEYGHFNASPSARDVDGLQMVYTPTWSGSVSYDHSFDLSGGASIDLRLGAYFSSSYWGTFDHSADALQDSYTRSDVSITYHSSSGRWSLGAWIKNIEDEAVMTGLAGSGYSAPYAGAAFLEPPRTYGVKVGFKM